MIYCESCATEMSSDAAFCTHCGRRRNVPNFYESSPPLRSATTSTEDRKILVVISLTILGAILLTIIGLNAPSSHVTTSNGILATVEWGSELDAMVIAQVAATKRLRSSKMADFGGAEAKRKDPTSFEVIGVGESTNGFGAYGKFGYRALVKFTCPSIDCATATDVVVFNR